MKIANYCLDRWTDLERYAPVDQIQQMLRICRRQYDQYIKLKVNLKNNLIALIDNVIKIRTEPKGSVLISVCRESWLQIKL